MAHQPELQANYEPNRSYLVKGSILNLIIRGLHRARMIPGEGITEIETPSGTVWTATGGSSSGGTSGAFFTVYQDAGKWWLQGGQVTAGDDTVILPAIELGTVSSEPADGTDFWLEIPGDGVEDSGVLLPGFNGDGTASASSGASVPANDLPDVSGLPGSIAGTCYVYLGTWNSAEFTPAAVGNVQVSFCPGAFTVSRF